jgi:predicted GNAT superfamily acetyltransferase
MTVRVSMSLTDRDVTNADTLAGLIGSRNKAEAVSTALSLTRLVAEKMSAGGEVFVKRRDGGIERITIDEPVR